MITCTTEDNDPMDPFTRVVDLYTSSNVTPPETIVNLLREEKSHLSRLVRSEEVKEILSIMEDEHEGATYPLKHTGCVSMLIPHFVCHLGEGTYGHVYSMVSESYREEIAVKFQEHSEGSGNMFVTGPGGEDIPMNSFELEVIFQLQMSSLGFAPVVLNAWSMEYNTIWGDGLQDVLVMEKMHKTLREKCIEYTKFTCGVIKIVEDMHEANIFHGDLHSQNIMVDEIGMPKIIDFGKSKAMPTSQEDRKWCILHDLQNLHNTLSKRSSLKALVLDKAIQVSPELRANGSTFDFY